MGWPAHGSAPTTAATSPAARSTVALRRAASHDEVLSHLIRGAAIEAILGGTEKITKRLLESIDLDHAAQSKPQGPGSPR